MFFAVNRNRAAPLAPITQAGLEPIWAGNADVALLTVPPACFKGLILYRWRPLLKPMTDCHAF